jgi:hypothetical protein
MADPKKPSNYDEVMDEKTRKKEQAAYEKASRIGPYTADKTPARKKAESMELERTYPMASKMAKETPVKAQSVTDAIKGSLGIPTAIAVDMATGPKRRSEEDMSELTREVARGNKMASGGSASSRADGCAQRGKTKGMVVGMNKGGMSC